MRNFKVLFLCLKEAERSVRTHELSAESRRAAAHPDRLSDRAGQAAKADLRCALDTNFTITF